MKLRNSICLWILAGLLLAVGYLSVRTQYMKLHDRYEELLVDAELQADGQADGEKEDAVGALSESAADNIRDGSRETDETEGTDQGRKPGSREETFYYVTLRRNEIIAYSGDNRQVCLRTQIDETELAAVLLQELRQGIYLENLPALYEYLENCSS